MQASIIRGFFACGCNLVQRTLGDNVKRKKHMATRSRSPCRHPGCRVLLSESGFCETHIKHKRKQTDDRRGSAADRGYGGRWQKARLTFLSRQPLCVECAKSDRTELATIVDHVIPHKGDQDLFWDTSNWQPLCKRHHDQKTAREDGGFGRIKI
jgi:5-methylcytosine-specific restriction protein A